LAGGAVVPDGGGHGEDGAAAVEFEIELTRFDRLAVSRERPHSTGVVGEYPDQALGQRDRVTEPFVVVGYRVQVKPTETSH
jgi:hypothetical protein